MEDKQGKVFMAVPFFQAPNDMYEIGLDPYELAVFGYLTRLGNQGGRAFPSYQTIAEKTTMSKRKAIATVKSLEEKSLLFKEVRRKSNDDNYTNIYHVAHDLSKYLPSARHAPGSAGDAPIKRTTRKRTKDNNVTPLRGNDGLVFFIYANYYEKRFGREHPRISDEQVNEVEYRLVDKGWNLFELDKIVRYHFDNLPDGNDGNINAFVKAVDRYEYEALGNY